MGETESASKKCKDFIATGACPLEPKIPSEIPLPVIPSDPNARYSPKPDFVEKMIELFKNGGKLPKRVVWEIVLGVKDIVDKERSMVKAEVGEGVVCDVVGDTHGVSSRTRT
jgi:serine/threonine-protein phosphatase 5